MAILLSGDFHAGSVGELSVITKKNLIKKYGKELYSHIKYHIILGDAGFMWDHNKERDEYNCNALRVRPFPILCVMGNHEPVYGKKYLPEDDIGIGEKVIVVKKQNPFIAYLKRGKIYNIDGLKILVLGGALSVDREGRIEGKSWWKEEYWSEEEKNDVFNLIKKENKFDFVMSHTGPDRINRILFKYTEGDDSEKFYDQVAFLNNKIEDQILFLEWWCGHFHENIFYKDTQNNSGYQYLYKSTKIIEKKDNEIIIYSENIGNNDGIREYIWR